MMRPTGDTGPSKGVEQVRSMLGAVNMFEAMSNGLSDLCAGLGWRNAWPSFAKEDIGESHKRTHLGPMRLLLNYLPFFGTLLFVFGNSLPQHVVHLPCRLLAWNLIIETVGQSVTLYVANESC